MNLANHL